MATSTSGFQLLLLGISLGTAFCLHTGSISNWQQIMTAVPGITSKCHVVQRQIRAVASRVSFSAVKRSPPAYRSELDHMATDCISQGLGWKTKATLCILDIKDLTQNWGHTQLLGQPGEQSSESLSLKIRGVDPERS